MHELAVTQNILEIALRHAAQASAKRIVGIDLTVGQFSSIVDDSIQFYWDMISEGTIARGAALRFNRVPAAMVCEDCGRGYRPDDETFGCPACGGGHVKIVAGTEFRVDSIEVD